MQSERSERLRELTPAARRRGLYFIDRCGGVLFPVALIPGVGYKDSLRVQSERSERLRELTPAARRRELPSAGTHGGSGKDYFISDLLKIISPAVVVREM